jgi:hypothetical protein
MLDRIGKNGCQRFAVLAVHEFMVPRNGGSQVKLTVLNDSVFQAF